MNNIYIASKLKVDVHIDSNKNITSKITNDNDDPSRT